MNNNKRILIVDDDELLSNVLSDYLQEQGFKTLVASSAIEMEKQRERFHCDLLVLDVVMLEEDGFAVCQRLRADGDKIPIVMLSGRDQSVDRILGLEFGADDYVAKPVEPRELLARIKAVLRRTSEQSLKAYESKPVLFEFGDFVLDGHSQSVTRNGNPVLLSSGEFALLMVLTGKEGKPMTRNQLVNQLKGGDHKYDQRNIDMLVSRLRKHIDDDPAKTPYIRTVRGVGYVFINSDSSLTKSE